MIAVPYVHGMLRDETVSAVNAQWGATAYYGLSPSNPYGYADLIRILWRQLGPLVINEQDVVPPPGAHTGFDDCTALWCTHECEYNGKMLAETLGLVRFSRVLRFMEPDLADVALAQADGRAWTRHGLTGLAPDTTEEAMARHGERLCMRPDAVLPTRADGSRIWPSTCHWKVCDTMLARELRARGYGPHVHQPAAQHLHFAGGATTS